MAFTNYDKCSLLLPMDGTNNGTTFTDWSPSPKTVTVVGNAKTATAQSKHYGSSGYFGGAGDYLSVADHQDFSFGGGDFTISAYIRPTAYASNNGGEYQAGIVTKDLVGAREFSFNLRGTSTSFTELRFIGLASGGEFTILSGPASINLNQWYHTAVVRQGNNVYLFLDGVLLNSGASAFSRVLLDTTTPLKVGAAAYSSTYQYYFTGYIQDVLIIKGATLWTSNFTPPARLIGQLSGNVKDYAGANAQRTIAAMPRTTPTRAFTTTSDPGTGNYTLRAPSVESSAILLANEPTLYNDLVHRVTPE